MLVSLSCLWLVVNSSCPVPDFNSHPWQDAVLVTPRRVVRDAWNRQSLYKHCRKSGQRLYVCPAMDYVHKREATLEEQLEILRTKRDVRLPPELELAIGMKAMVLFNIATEADLANGTRGTVVDIRLDPRESLEPDIDDEGKTHLLYPPALIIFKPDTPCCLTFSSPKNSSITNLESGLIPLTPSNASFRISPADGSAFTVVRYQYAIGPAYAFTDYKSQGQTILYLIVNLATPPSPGMSLTARNVYVALSRSCGRNSIRILREFDPSILTSSLDPDLLAEDQRLELLGMRTLRRYVRYM